jgi:hypothetical protein
VNRWWSRVALLGVLLIAVGAVTWTLTSGDDEPKTHGHVEILCLAGYHQDGTRLVCVPDSDQTIATASTTPDGRSYYDGPCPAGQVASPVLAPPNCVGAKNLG